MLLAWARAILLQLAHPLIAAGVYDHSSFRSGPLTAAARLHHTVRAMLGLTFGDERERAQAIDGIMTIHRRVNGVLPEAAGRFPAGTPYTAEDPDLVLWVHATLLESIPLVYERVVRRLSDAERDEYCAEAKWVAVALGARAAEVPVTAAAVHAYLEAMHASGSIAVSRQARELASAVMAPPLSAFIAPVVWANRLVTVGLLPDRLRQEYGFAWHAGDDAARRRVLATIAATRAMTPRALAWWPEARR